MHYTYTIAKRIIFNGQPSFSRFIIRLAIAATALSVATMVITLALVNGFQTAVAEKVFAFWGQMRVQGLNPLQGNFTEDAGFLTSDSVLSSIKSQKEITHYHAYAIKSVVLKTKGQFEGVLLKGVNQDFEKAGFEKYIVNGQNISFDLEGQNAILLSRQTAQRLEVNAGDTIQCFFIRNGENIRSRPMIVSGIYNTSIEEYDKNFAIADIRFVRKLNQWADEQVGGYEMQVEPGTDIDQLSKDVNAGLPLQLAAVPIKEIYPQIFDWLNIQDQTKGIVIITMLVVAIINLITCLLILVMERTRMVGVLKSLGMPNRDISSIFWVYAGWIALVGIGMGLLLGLGLAFLQQYTGFIKMDEATYYVSEVPVDINFWQILFVVAASFITCILAVRIPLFYVQRISPIKAIRFD